MRFSRVDRIIRDLREHSGPGTATHAKVVLSGILGLAVRHDALDSNPMRELTPSRRGKNDRKTKVNLTEESLVGPRKHLRASDDAVKADLVDLIDVLSGLGCLIGELLALDWTKVDEKAGTLAIEGTVIRVPGKGLIVQPHTKPSAGMRTITIPAWVLEILVRRYESAAGEWVFPSTKGTLRDAGNTRTRLRAVLKGMSGKGLAPARVPPAGGHPARCQGPVRPRDRGPPGPRAVSMTQDVYMARRVTGALAADAMENLAPNQNDGQKVERSSSGVAGDRSTSDVVPPAGHLHKPARLCHGGSGLGVSTGHLAGGSRVARLMALAGSAQSC
jgi:integrase